MAARTSRLGASPDSVTLRPSHVVRDHTRDGHPAVLLVHEVAPGTSLTRPVPGDAWSASPIDRAAELARASNVALALVTDGIESALRQAFDAAKGKDVRLAGGPARTWEACGHAGGFLGDPARRG